MTSSSPSSTALDAAPEPGGGPALKSWSRAPQFRHDYEARTALPPRRDAEAPAVYLTRLRAAVAEHRDRINAELTDRMDEDKKREAAAAAEVAGPKGDGPPPSQGANKRKAAAAVDQEALEEQNYGEEVVEED